MVQNKQPLKTLKEVAKKLERPAHRIIHLCEKGAVCPTGDASGRGSMRRFSGDDLFRVLVALELQEAGVRVPLIKPLIEALDTFHDDYCSSQHDYIYGPLDLVNNIKKVGSKRKPVRAFLHPPESVALLAPGLKLSFPSSHGYQLFADETKLPAWKVCIAINLTAIAAQL
jgi:DNA-binding transcriptional MerR regulator